MTYSSDTFRQYCLEAARQFLQTVVVIDNEAVFDMDALLTQEEEKVKEKRGSELTSPANGRLIGKATSVNVTIDRKAYDTQKMPSKFGLPRKGLFADNMLRVPITRDQKIDYRLSQFEHLSHVLDAKRLMDNFADEQIICSIIKPERGESDFTDRSIRISMAADIVVLDWMLDNSKGGTGSKTAREIIKGIIENDIESRGRLRLIAVYTAEPNPSVVLDQLLSIISELPIKDNSKIHKDDKSLTIQFSYLKIAVLSKPSVSAHAGICPVPFELLPEKLIKLFGTFVN